MLKRGYQGTLHHFPEKHADRYVTEFAGRYNVRNGDTIDMMAHMVQNRAGGRLRYSQLTSDD